MISRIRDVRKAKGLTLDDVAKRCDPPTTAQTIGRLETGMRTLSLDWLNRIADALAVDSAELLALPDQDELPVAAMLDHKGAHALKKTESISQPTIETAMVALRVKSSIGDYRAGDDVWLSRRTPDQYSTALNRDILVPRPAGRFLFGRLIGREGDMIQILPLGSGARQQVVKDPEWIGVAVRLVRAL
ncbi:helix-turn-helix domain-containing protein [Parasphingorhabdus cellanae]|uniref:Helix-turn-helix transcriptional regulator n=1 Tax=Parasphingorhabdus cellanae TaxID=2806553 RepID=A0ABX7T2T3_9SPHN|nr:helix-turn-helix transcriptional regulator [Parasphingorhabdus cellanae]QTD55870.1 helix-turn-helix transcriptional regulator [Parasphingorhabdus cellanae]